MKQYKFNKPLIETALPVRDTRAYYVNIDEKTNELANIMEFKDGQWQVKYFIDDVATWERSSAKLDIPNKIKLNPNGIITAWLQGDSEYKNKVKQAADDFSYIIGELKALTNVLSTAIPMLSGIVDDVEASGATEAASTITTVVNSLKDKAFSDLINGNAIEHLKALNVAINNENTSKNTNN